MEILYLMEKDKYVGHCNMHVDLFSMLLTHIKKEKSYSSLTKRTNLFHSKGKKMQTGLVKKNRPLIYYRVFITTCLLFYFRCILQKK